MVHNKWLIEEMNIIRKNYKEMSDEELHNLIPNHSVCSISTKRKDMGLKRPVWNKKYSFEDFKKELEKRNYILLSNESDFQNTSSIMKYKCLLHMQDIQETTLGRLLEGKGCMYCGRERTRIAEIIPEKKCMELCKKRGFIYVDSKVINKCTTIFFICPKHKNSGIQKMTYQNMERDGYGCKYCRSSLTACSNGEKRIKDFLEQLNISFVQQYKFDDCKDQCALPFDFYLPEYKLTIEFDGQHHYRPVTFNSVPYDKALYLHQQTVKHDMIKDNYCKNHKIKIIRIPYWDIDDLEIILFDKFVKYKIIERIA